MAVDGGWVVCTVLMVCVELDGQSMLCFIFVEFSFHQTWPDGGLLGNGDDNGGGGLDGVLWSEVTLLFLKSFSMER